MCAREHELWISCRVLYFSGDASQRSAGPDSGTLGVFAILMVALQSLLPQALLNWLLLLPLPTSRLFLHEM